LLRARIEEAVCLDNFDGCKKAQGNYDLNTCRGL